jgi:hypothetical protein
MKHYLGFMQMGSDLEENSDAEYDDNKKVSGD